MERHYEKEGTSHFNRNIECAQIDNHNRDMAHQFHDDSGPSNPIPSPANLAMTAPTLKASPIHKLPAELILSIANYLDPPARNSLRMTCRLLCSTVSGFTRAQMCGDCQADFKKLIRRDRYAEHCQMELNGSPRKNQLVCSKCMEPHFEIFFSQPQKSLSPYTRACLGMQGYVELCPHSTVSFDELRAKVYHADGSIQDSPMTKILCMKCSARPPRQDTFRQIYLAFWPRTQRSESSPAAQVSIRRDHLVMRYPMHKVLFEDDLAKALNKLDVRICPHTRLKDLTAPPEAHQNRESAEGSTTRHGPRRLNRAPLPIFPLPKSRLWDPVFQGVCRVMNCNTKVALHLDPGWYPGEIEVIAKIDSKLGPLHDATDPRWLRHVIIPVDI